MGICGHITFRGTLPDSTDAIYLVAYGSFPQSASDLFNFLPFPPQLLQVPPAGDSVVAYGLPLPNNQYHWVIAVWKKVGTLDPADTASADSLLREAGYYRDPADSTKPGVVTVHSAGTGDIDFVVDFEQHAQCLVLLSPMIRPLALLALACAAPLAAVAQQTGTIVGMERDTTGAPVAGAKIEVAGAAFTLTGADGRFRLNDVPAGSVRVRAAAFAFRADSTDLTVPSGDSVTWNVTLRSGVFYIPGVVVTAGKRPESLENVAASVEVASDRSIARHAVNTIDEAVNYVPAVQFIDGQVNIRGSSGFQQAIRN